MANNGYPGSQYAQQNYQPQPQQQQQQPQQFNNNLNQMNPNQIPYQQTNQIYQQQQMNPNQLPYQQTNQMNQQQMNLNQLPYQQVTQPMAQNDQLPAYSIERIQQSQGLNQNHQIMNQNQQSGVQNNQFQQQQIYQQMPMNQNQMQNQNFMNNNNQNGMMYQQAQNYPIQSMQFQQQQPYQNTQQSYQQIQNSYNNNQFQNQPQIQHQVYDPLQPVQFCSPCTGKNIHSSCVLNLKFEIGRKRALLIGINYIGTSSKLNGCINDVHNMRDFLCQQYGFQNTRDTMVVLTDDNPDNDYKPTRINILNGMRWLVNGVQPGDSLVFHFSGHGSQAEDRSGDEVEGFDSTICPLDHQKSGQIIDDVTYN